MLSRPLNEIVRFMPLVMIVAMAVPATVDAGSPTVRLTYEPEAILAEPPNGDAARDPDQPATFNDDPFAEGTRIWSVITGVSRDYKLGEIYLTQFSAGYYVLDDLAIHFGGILAYANAKRTDGGVYGGPKVGIRWHILKDERWSLYIDGTAGTVFHQNPLTPDSLRFNFDLQAGAGVTYRFDNDLMLRGGVRWHHLSNARIRGKERNLGYDGPMGYIGIMRPF